MSAEVSDVEALLRSALVPVEPSERMTDRLERSLSDITDIAAGELADWELSAMRDPRNWMPTVTAAAVGAGAAVGLAVVRTQRKRHKRRAASGNVLELAEHTVRDFAREAGKIIDEGKRRL